MFVILFGLLILTLDPPVFAQLVDVPEPIFPADSKDPQKANGKELLEAVCPGRVTGGKELRCRIVCPSFTSFLGDHFEWVLVRVTLGHFLSPASDDAVLSMAGCEPHSTNYGGTILLTRRSAKWKMLWYKAGVQTEQCHKVLLASKRELLVCLGVYGGQGRNSTALYLEDLRSPTGSLMADGRSLFEIPDDTVACGSTTETKATLLTAGYIEKVTFSETRSGRQMLTVIAKFGTRMMEPQDVQACVERTRHGRPQGKASFYPRVKRYRVDFLFNGRNYYPASHSVANFRIIASK